MRLARSTRDPKVGGDMTPMIDVTFLILIFFMCTLNFRNLEGLLEANLPEGVGVDPSPADPPPPPVEVRIQVLDPGTNLTAAREVAPEGYQGRIVHGPDRVLEYRVGPWKTGSLAQLETHLRSVHQKRQGAQTEPLRSTLAPGPKSSHQDVMAVLDRIHAAGYLDVAFVGTEEF